ncbi:putative RNA-directed DNA polymerase from transposon X-element [Trichonephila clavipes]|nr:putative RNA-directed DNA polymerase from transposon X-element [Trichonephila clavipes]
MGPPSAIIAIMSNLINCHLNTRCLKCGQSHKTNECPIKEKIPNPTCVNCNVVGHMANWHECPVFPKIKAKKGDASQNRNEINQSKPVNNNPTYANSNKTSQQRVPHDRSKPVNSEPIAPKTHTENNTPPPRGNKNQNQNDVFAFIDAVKEIKTLFKEFPYLLDLGKALKTAPNTKSNDRQNIYPLRPGGGTSILAKTSLTHHNIPTPPLGEIEATTVAPTPSSGSDITVSSIYILPSSPNTSLITDIEVSLPSTILLFYAETLMHTIFPGVRNLIAKEELF